jgi:hypothetical protein
VASEVILFLQSLNTDHRSRAQVSRIHNLPEQLLLQKLLALVLLDVAQ